MKALILFFAMAIVAGSRAQTLYSLDASKVNTTIRSGYFKMGDPGPSGRQLEVNSRYLTIGGVPRIPVMGELQYSRMPRERWEDEILKMKAGGVTVIATYVFWIHHEEMEGQFDWSGNKDLRSFVKLCQRLGVLVYPRIGPWAHGEVRNGGTPDWILRKKYLTDRSIDPVYQSYVERYFRQIGLQLKGLLYKDGGPVMGIQLENEYWHGKAGEPYIYWLKQTALKYGMDVPLYTVTGWGDGSVPLNEVIPLWGGYPDESWDPNIEKITACDNYAFSRFRDDTTIGNAQVTKKDAYDYSLDPYFTCEMGVGIFNSIQRRPVIGALDGLGLIVSRIGSGGNLLGYYVFAGGSNPLGLYSTMEENKDETGSWSELSPISYDFQAAIRENGLPAPSYYEVKRLNYFLDQFGSLLAPMEPVFATVPATGQTTNQPPARAGQATGQTPLAPAQSTLQYAARVKDNSGFLFGINYCRNNRRPEQKGVQFLIKLKDQTIIFPSVPVNIPDSSLFIWPMNLDLDGVRLNYATAQPLFHTAFETADGSKKTTGAADQPGKTTVWVFTQDVNLLPEFSIDDAGVDKVLLPPGNGALTKNGHAYVISRLRPGMDAVLSVIRKDGTTLKIVLLSKEQGRQSWILPDSEGKEGFYISRATLYTKDNQLYLMDTLTSMRVWALTGAPRSQPARQQDVASAAGSLFTMFRQDLPEKHMTATANPKGALQDAQWLVTSVKSIDAGTLLYHREFQKEFSADDPSRIKSAKLILAAESDCRVRVNDQWVGQPVKTGSLDVLDLTGYVRKGDNVLLMDFPYRTGEKAFAARVLVEYFNTDRLDFSTDSSWLVADQYYFPATYGSKPVFPMGFAAPKIAPVPAEEAAVAHVPGGAASGSKSDRLSTPASRTAPASAPISRASLSRQSLPDLSEWTVPLPCDYLDGLNNVYLDVKYQGDRLSARFHDKLIADDLNNNTPWLMNLKQGDISMDCQELQLELRPWMHMDQIYFDRAPSPSEEGLAAIEHIRFVPEYKAVVPIPE